MESAVRGPLIVSHKNDFGHAQEMQRPRTQPNAKRSSPQRAFVKSAISNANRPSTVIGVSRADCERVRQVQQEPTRCHKFENHLGIRKSKKNVWRTQEPSMTPSVVCPGYLFARNKSKIEVTINPEQFFDRDSIQNNSFSPEMKSDRESQNKRKKGDHNPKIKRFYKSHPSARKNLRPKSSRNTPKLPNTANPLIRSACPNQNYEELLSKLGQLDASLQSKSDRRRSINLYSVNSLPVLDEGSEDDSRSYTPNIRVVVTPIEKKKLQNPISSITPSISDIRSPREGFYQEHQTRPGSIGSESIGDITPNVSDVDDDDETFLPKSVTPAQIFVVPLDRRSLSEASNDRKRERLERNFGISSGRPASSRKVQSGVKRSPAPGRKLRNRSLSVPDIVVSDTDDDSTTVMKLRTGLDTEPPILARERGGRSSLTVPQNFPFQN
ncbi:DgyrCDS7718 [Dimorphilus gyrociliatus]|uniref:DgyrCDS7718 n=1 Tax=Dimorphilus gyrociliatus TaxID=2664684 RepID=A0A7I8VWV7_9ANNE|nr:DgyrCDS7718 [Dimorphilus gyrociliatus]